MSEQSRDLAGDAIAHFLRSRSADPDLGLLNDIVRTVETTPQDRAWLGFPSTVLPRRTLLIVASGLLLAAMGAIGVGSRFLQPDPLSITFGGTWISTSDADGGTQTMSVAVSGEGNVDITVRDTIASVCSGTPSTMTGTGAIEGDARLVIAAPVYACDDGSQPQGLSGPPLGEQLRNWTLALDPQAGTLTDSVGGVWYRENAAIPSPDPSSAPLVSGQMWPQTTLEEVLKAQERADAGDPAYTWQLDTKLAADEEPWAAEIFGRFIEEKLGWEEFVGGWDGSGHLSMGPGGGSYQGVVFIRCAPGETNPLSRLYADAPDEIRGCAPTIDEFRYETVSVDVSQSGRRGADGIWVVDGWELRRSESSAPNALFGFLYPEFDGQVAQVVPPSDAEVTAVLEAFLRDRVEGDGAEQYLLREPEASPFENKEVPLLYATTSGAPYERFEIEHVQGPVWPSGWSEFKVRLFADETVVEQVFAVVREQEGRLGLVYGFPQTDELATTENGHSVPVPYSVLDGEVTFAAAPPWDVTRVEPSFTILGGVGRGSLSQFTMLTVVADPLTGTGCDLGPAAAAAEALVRSIRTNPDLEATDPVAVSVGGIDAVMMDVLAPRQLEVGDCQTMVAEHLSLSPDDRMRLYLLDLPDGMSSRIVAIAITAHGSQFEHVVEAAMPVLDSFEFQTP
jgi:hypothetical protein